MKLLKFLLFIVLSINLCACVSVREFLPKEKRAFQERSFDSKLWLAGDEQTRGEMAKDLQWKKIEPNGGYFLRNKTQSEIVELLGEPDEKSRGKCCQVSYAPEVEVWLYEIEVKEEFSNEKKTKHFQIYFSPDGKVEETRIAEWDERNPDYIPRMG